jgi:hypothetical protein
MLCKACCSSVVQSLAANAGKAHGEVSHKKCCLVAPAGLLNGNNLRAMTEAGYVAASGDNTWGSLYLDVNNPYRMLRTTAAGSNFPGFLIIPRWVTY